jgi:hypothetical protein
MARFSRWFVGLLTGMVVLISVLLLADPVKAQPLQCDSVDQVLTYLADQFDEQLVGEGQGPNGTRLLLFAHPQGDTWTVIGVIPGDKACFIASGTNWTDHEPTPAGSET